MSFYRLLAWPLIRRIDAEAAHRFTLDTLQGGLLPLSLFAGRNDPVLATTLFGHAVANPIGLAAGFDKNAEVPDAMLRAGFGFVEVGGVTPQPQAGNPRPRLFRLEEDRAVINRMGFNNEGLDVVAQRLHTRRHLPGLVGVNLGANKDSADRPGDYAILYERLAPLCGFAVVNVSSPNTPGLRNLQGREELAALLARLAPLRAALHTPLLVKIAPDLADEDIDAVADLVLQYKLDGVVATNTTIARDPALRSPGRGEAGGLSGAPLFERSTAVLRQLHRHLRGAATLIGVGGVASGEQAYVKIRAGASAVQLYSALVYEGPSLVGRIKAELAALLRRDGCRSVADAVGRDA